MTYDGFRFWQAKHWGENCRPCLLWAVVPPGNDEMNKVSKVLIPGLSSRRREGGREGNGDKTDCPQIERLRASRVCRKGSYQEGGEKDN